MPDPHPTDRTLARFVDGELDDGDVSAVAIHVAGCARCQFRVGPEPIAVPGAGERLLGLPVEVVEASNVTPEVGDIWRLSWNDTTVLAVVWPSDLVGRLLVLPVVDDWVTDEGAVPVSATASGIGAIRVSVALATDVPWSVLDARVEHLDDLRAIGAAYDADPRGGGASPDRRGRPATAIMDERTDAIAEVEDQLALLSNVGWAPTAAAATLPTPSFETLVTAGLAPNRALAVIRGATPSDTEATLIEAETGMRPVAASVPEDLQRLIDLPARKRAIRAQAQARGQDESETRLGLARQAEPALAAARGTQGKPPNYEEILDRLLRE